MNRVKSAPESAAAVTTLLVEVRDGVAGAEEKLFNLTYGELKKIARRYMRHERVNHTLQPSALVNEACLRLLGTAARSWQSRAHFLAHAGQAMRRVLVDHARARGADKRGGERIAVSLDDPLAEWAEPASGIAGGLSLELVIAVDAALKALAAIDPRQAKIFELQYFAGLNEYEIAFALEVSVRTVFRAVEKGKKRLLDHFEGRSLIDARSSPVAHPRRRRKSAASAAGAAARVSRSRVR